MRANRFLGSGGTLNKVFNCATLINFYYISEKQFLYFERFCTDLSKEARIKKNCAPVDFSEVGELGG